MSTELFHRQWLRLRVACARWQPIAAAGLAGLSMAAGALAWLGHAQAQLAAQSDSLERRPRPAAASVVRATAPSEMDNLTAFYGMLGDRRSARQQLKILFSLAQEAGLELREGTYAAGYDRAARVHTYQVNLPMQGSHRAIWHFAMQALLLIPFASLDEISFRRDKIGDAQVEARVRMTLYVADAGEGGPR